MNVHRWPSVAGLSVLILGSALFIRPISAVAASGDPAAYQVAVAGPINITTQASPTPLATLNVPKGKWVAWARVQVYYDGIGYRLIQCSLNATNGAIRRSIPAESQSLTAATGALGEPDTDDFALSASLSSPTLAAKFAVRCRNLSGVYDAIPRASNVRIVAMKLGTLNQRSMSVAIASQTASSVRTAKRVTGAELVHGYRLTDLPIQKAAKPKTVASLPLDGGKWFIHATFGVVGVNGHGQDPPVNSGKCRLLLAKDGARSSAAATDFAFLDVLDADWEGHRRVYALDVATTLKDPGSARLQCWQDDGSGDLVVRGLRITALRAGTLSTVDPLTGAATLTRGSRSPLVLHARRTTTNLPARQSVDVAKINLAAGRWFLMAKVFPLGDDTDCRIVVQGVEIDEVYDPWLPSGLVMEMAPNLAQAGQALLRCTGGSENSSVGWARFTAIRGT